MILFFSISFLFLSFSISVLLLVLGAIHFNWVLGGKFGFAESLPTNEKGERVLNPKKMGSAVVGIALTSFGIFYLSKSGIIAYNLPECMSFYGGWAIPILFLLRAIGEFKYIGFFKKIKKTDFGKMDTLFFSPLCLAIGVFGIVIQLLG